MKNIKMLVAVIALSACSLASARSTAWYMGNYNPNTMPTVEHAMGMACTFSALTYDGHKTRQVKKPYCISYAFRREETKSYDLFTVNTEGVKAGQTCGVTVNSGKLGEYTWNIRSNGGDVTTKVPRGSMYDEMDGKSDEMIQKIAAMRVLTATRYLTVQVNCHGSKQSITVAHFMDKSFEEELADTIDTDSSTVRLTLAGLK